MLQRPQQRHEPFFKIMEIDNKTAAVKAPVPSGDRHRHAPIVAVQRLQRPVGQPQLVQCVKFVLNGDIEVHLRG